MFRPQMLLLYFVSLTPSYEYKLLVLLCQLLLIIRDFLAFYPLP